MNNIIWYEPNMTSDTEPSPYVASASTTYRPAFNAFADKSINTTYWASSVDNQNNAWIKLDFGETRKVDAFSIQGNNSVNESPRSMKLSYSLDNSTWVDTYTSVEAVWTAGEVRTYNLDNSVNARYFRLTIINNHGARYSGLTYLKFGYIKLPENKSLIYNKGEYKKYNAPVIGETYSIIPTMTSATTPSGIVDSSSNYSTTYAAWKAFDKKHQDPSADSWLSSTSIPAWISYETETENVVKSISIISRNDSYANRAPRNFTFEGYNESNGTWEVLYTKVDEASWSSNETRVYEFENNKKYKKHRLNVTSSRDNYIGIAELDMITRVEPVDGYWEDISQSLPTTTQFETIGMDELSPLFDRKIQTLEPISMTIDDSLLPGENGKLFTKTIDLNKYFDLKSIKVETN